MWIIDRREQVWKDALQLRPCGTNGTGRTGENCEFRIGHKLQACASGGGRR